MQLVQPQVKELQKKFGHDREKLAQETMKLYKDTGTNPFASCLPLIIQMPIFFALFRLIDHAAKNREGHGFLTDDPGAELRRRPVLRRRALRELHQQRRPPGRQDRRRHPRRRDDADHVPDPAPADEQEHAGRRAVRALRQPAEDAALRAARGVRRRRHRVPDRCPPVLDHVEPVDDGPAVLRDPEQPRAQHRGVPGQAEARQREALEARACPSRGPTLAGGGAVAISEAEAPEAPKPVQRQQPKKQSRRRAQEHPPATAEEARRTQAATPKGDVA